MSEDNSDQLETDRVASRLLAESDGMAVDEREDLFDDIYREVSEDDSDEPPREATNDAASTTPTETSGWGRNLAIAAAALLVAIPAVIWFGVTNQPPDDSFTARGGAHGSFQPVCLNDGNGPTTCHPGSTLGFTVDPPTSARYFAAFGRSAEGTVYWFFPAKPGDTSIALTDSGPDRPLEKSVVLNDDLAPGDVTVYGVFSPEALTRDAIRSYFDESGSVQTPANVHVVRRKLEVE